MTDERRHEGFTPGPWEVADVGGGMATIESGDDWVCECGAKNASLICAAPSLLAALREFRELMQAFDMGPACSEAKKWLAKADSALALVSPPNPRGTT